MISGSGTITIDSNGLSTFPKSAVEVYSAKIMSFLEGVNYDVFGSNDRRAELRVFKFRNTTTEMKDSLQKTVKELLLIEFPEIENVSITEIYEKSGMIAFSVKWSLIDTTTTTEVLI